MTFVGGGGGQPQITIGAPIYASGTVNAPGAGVSIAQTAGVPAAGIYELVGGFIISGAVETQPENVRLAYNATNWISFPTSGGVNVFVPIQVPRISLNGINAVALQANFAAAVSTVYAAFFTLIQLSN